MAYVIKGFGDVNMRLGFQDEAIPHYLKSYNFFRRKDIKYGYLLSSTCLKKMGFNGGGYIT